MFFFWRWRLCLSVCLSTFIIQVDSNCLVKSKVNVVFSFNTLTEMATTVNDNWYICFVWFFFCSLILLLYNFDCLCIVWLEVYYDLYESRLERVIDFRDFICHEFRFVLCAFNNISSNFYLYLKKSDIGMFGYLLFSSYCIF